MDMRSMSDDLILTDQVWGDGSCVIARSFYDEQNNTAYQVDFSKGYFRVANITADEPIAKYGDWKKLID